MNFNNYFKAWEFHHLASRAYQFGLDNKKLLSKVGDELQDGKELDVITKQKLDEALHQLSEIKHFADICSREDCETCNKLYNLYRLESLDKGISLEEIEGSNAEEWELDLELL